jgi:hypothetical protein
MRILSTLAVLPLVMLAPGCASTADEAEDGVEESEEALTGSVNGGYYIVTARDARRCPSPMCGGYFVKRVNAAVSRCADGSLQPSCYVAQIDTSALGLTDENLSTFTDALAQGQALVKAPGMGATQLGAQRFGKLVAQEAWLAQSAASAPRGSGPGSANVLPTGSFRRIKDSGIRCVRAPCPSVRAFKLNSALSQSVTDLGFSSAPATSVDAARAAVYTDQGFLAAGDFSRGAPGELTFGMTQFYLRMKAGIASGQACGSRGLGACAAGLDCVHPIGALCGRADAPGTCRVRPAGCPKNLAQVCGCDGTTYGNECLANLLGVSVDYNGRCAAPAPAPCYVGGCSAQLCTDDPGRVSTCEWREQYACYRTAKCERQGNGTCGWTNTPALAACIAANP